MHRDMLKYTTLSYGGKFKTTPNEIDMTLPSGEKVVLFKPLEPYETSDAIMAICESYQKVLDKETIINSLSEYWKFFSRSGTKKLVEDGTLTKMGAGRRKTHYVSSDALDINL